jgi:hypothetical protein
MTNFNRKFLSIAFLFFYQFYFFSHLSFSQNYPVSDFDPNRQRVIAFPGAEGFGKYTTGGRGGQVVKVTNLNDSGVGSLRWALEDIRGPRIVVFEVSGNIELKSILNVRDGNLTIAGQTAPGDGITIQNFPLRVLDQKNVIIRYIRVRMGDLFKSQNDAFEARGGSDLIVDHCSFSWGTDETCSVYDISNVTIQNSIIAEGLNSSIHEKGEHGYGSLFGGNNISFYKNLMAHFLFRMPSLKSAETGEGIIDLRNNVIYNWSQRAMDNGPRSKTNIYNNYFKPGPATKSSGGYATQNFLWPTGLDYGKFYLEGNKLVGVTKIDSDQWSGVRLETSDRTRIYLESLKNKDSNGKLVPFQVPSGLYSYNLPAVESYEAVMENVGANLFRDAIDLRIINETRNSTNTFRGSKTGLLGIIDSQKDVGGWPKLNSNPSPKDTDQDGMPDEWESSNNLDPNKSNDREYSLSPYYTNIEVYINSLVQDKVSNQYPNQPGQVSLLLPNTNETISPEELSFSWSHIVNSSHYQIQISKTIDFSSGIISINNIKNLSLVYPKLDSNSTYYWRVRAINNDISGPYSSSRPFKTNSLSSVPGKTVILNPSNEQSNVGLESIIEWAKVPNAIDYQIQISTASDFSSTVFNQSGITLTSIKTPKLSENRTYYTRVRARNGAGSGSYSSINIFKTVSFDTTPSIIVPIRPTNGVLVNPINIRLEWEPNPTAQSYTLQVSTSSTFTSNVIFQRNITNPFFEIPSLNSGVKYYWKVVGVNRRGTGPFSVLSNNYFVTKTYDKAPSQIVPTLPVHDSNIFSTSITFAWQPDPLAKNYTFQLSTSPQFSSFVTNVSNLTETTRIVTGLVANTQYYWRVYATNEAGSSPASTVMKVRSATYSGPPAATQLVSPENKATVGISNVLFVWANQPNTESYLLEISEKSDFSTLYYSKNSIKGTSFVVPTLANNKTYYWRIRTSNPAGTGLRTSAWSFNTGSISNVLNQPTLLGPSNAATNLSTSLSFSWESVENATQYEIQVAESSTFSPLVFSQNNITNLSINSSMLQESKTYFWRVRAFEGSTASAWSNVWAFGTKGAENVSSIQNGMVGYWKMEEGSGSKLVDHSGKNNNLTIQNPSSASWVNGKVENALSLLGNTNSFATIAHNSSVKIPNAITIAAWVKPRKLHRGHLVYKSDNSNGFELWLDDNGQIEFRLNRGKNGTAYKLRSNFNYSSSVGKWIHVAATFDGSTSKIYINGIEDQSESYNPFSIETVSGTLTIGAFGSIQRWQGEFDEFRIYDRPLNAVEINNLTQVSQNILEISPSTLVGHWKMEEGSGNILKDDSGNGNDATFENNSNVTWGPGKQGLAIQLTGESGRYATASHNNSLNIPNEITIAAWVKPTKLERNTIISKTDGSNGFELWLDHMGNIEFRLNRDKNGFTYKLLSKYNYSGSINSWIHVAATFDGSTSRIFVNGIEDISKQYSPFNIGTGSGNLIIGAFGTIQRFTGSIDDLRLYSSSLNNEEIKELFQGAANFRFGESLSDKFGNNSQSEPIQVMEFEPRNSNSEIPIELNLYPNPVENVINIYPLWINNGNLSISIYSMSGAILFENEIEVLDQKLTIELSKISIKPGNYILVVQDFNRREILKFIKK